MHIEVIEEVVHRQVGQDAQDAHRYPSPVTLSSSDYPEGLPEGSPPQDEIGRQANQPCFGGNVEVIVMGMAQRQRPALKGIGRVDRLIVADAHPQPGPVVEHPPGGLPVGHALQHGVVCRAYLDRPHIQTM
jgi:hypothetical protein